MTGSELEALTNSDKPLKEVVSILNPTQVSVKAPPSEINPTLEPEDCVLLKPKIQVTESEKFQPSPDNITQPEGFDFKDPFELILFLDDDVKAGLVKLHPWQIQFMLDFAMNWNQDLPFQAIVRAANGSGKDKYIIAACSVWLCMRHCLARCVITSSSGVQLDNQTDAYIDQLCKAVNKKIHPNIWKCNYRYYECLPTQSPMLLFATDEPGKAEGYHPLRFGAKLAIFESEAKTVPDEIHNAQSRCTGYTHRCLVSSPGIPQGHFFDLDSTALDRKALTDLQKQVTALDYVRYHVTAYDCSHIPRSDIERGKKNLPGGENGAAFKSQYLAEFGTTDEMVVIPYTYIWRSFNSAPKDGWIKEAHNTGGLDLSDGGDETCLTVRNGNKHLATIPFRFDNTEDTIEHLNGLFREWDLTSPEALIFADCGGIGKPMLDRLKRQGWGNIRYVDNRHKASQPKIYKNRNSEVWFHSRILFERGELIVIKEDKLIKQLSSRYYKVVDGRVHQLLTKVEQKSKGYPSPDRADSFILCFWNYKSTYVETREILNPPFQLPTPEKPKGDFDMRSWAKETDSSKFPEPSRGKDFTVLQKAVAQYNKQQLVGLERN